MYKWFFICLGIIIIAIIICIIPNSPRIIITKSKQPSFRIVEAEPNEINSPVRRSLGFFTTFLDAIEYVESKGNINAIGDNGQAIGCMQIHPIMIRDVNRILRRNEYTLDDRYDRNKSRQIWQSDMNHYCKDMSLENMARNWNGGPTGYKQEATKKYWIKIKNYLDNL